MCSSDLHASGRVLIVTARRSLLFAPASRPELLEKATRAGADIVCADLEDAVGPADKDSARAVGVRFLSESPAANFERSLRINSLRTPHGLKDVLALQASAWTTTARAASW